MAPRSGGSRGEMEKEEGKKVRKKRLVNIYVESGATLSALDKADSFLLIESLSGFSGMVKTISIFR